MRENIESQVWASISELLPLKVNLNLQQISFVKNAILFACGGNAVGKVLDLHMANLGSIPGTTFSPLNPAKSDHLTQSWD